MKPDLEQLSINTLRTLAIDAVQQANSGHPGTAMAMAPVVAARMAESLGRDTAWARDQTSSYLQRVEAYLGAVRVGTHE